MHATTMKTKRHYTAPVTQRATVELEGGFCASINKTATIEATQHDTGRDIDFSEGTDQDNNGGFTVSAWE